MQKVIKIHKTGSIKNMRFEDSFLSAPKNHEVTIRHQAIGVNFLDIIHRQGRIDIAKPFILGVEGSGFVERVGKSVKGFKIGDRVAYASLPSGSYSECRNIDSSQVIKLPRFVSFENAAAIMLKGLTAEYLLHQTYRVSRGTTILIHAAAGAMGLILSQWAKKIGATVIGVVSTRKKKELALKNGCDHVIIYKNGSFAKKVLAITKNDGVDVVYDGIGKNTFRGSVACLAPLGHLVSFGQASGPIQGIDINILMEKSNTITRPSLFVYTGNRKRLERMAGRLFRAIKKKKFKIKINQKFQLKHADIAHQKIQSRLTTGSTILLP